MALDSNKRKQKPPSGSRVAALVILILIIGAVTGYYLISSGHKTSLSSVMPQHTEEKPLYPVPHEAKDVNDTTVSPPVKSRQHLEENKTYQPDAEIPAVKEPVGAPYATSRLAIIIDDMGSSIAQAQKLAAINVPLTFSVIPGLRMDRDVAAFAATRKIETMIHIPMQSKGWPGQRLEANGLLVSMDSDEIAKRVSGFMQRLPGAVGVNNHMGSEFTEQEEKMAVVLQLMKKTDLFFVDSVTSPSSVGIKVAERLGVKSARRDVFLDNEQERGYILAQLKQAVKIARKNGSAIAICHPHAATIAALAASLPGFAGQGVQLVPVSDLVN